MRVYHFVNAEFGLDDIRNRHIKVSTIGNLNDPFDLAGAQLGDRALRQAYEDMIRSFEDQVGILCFSRRRDNPLQWAHYADRHRGICLGFDIADKDLLRVQYVSRRPKSIIGDRHADTALRERAVLNALLTKFSHWRYEHEERAFISLSTTYKRDGLHFLRFPAGMDLREVLVGYKSSLSKAEVEQAVGDLSNVAIRKVRPAFASFRIVYQQKKELWG